MSWQPHPKPLPGVVRDHVPVEALQLPPSHHRAEVGAVVTMAVAVTVTIAGAVIGLIVW